MKLHEAIANFLTSRKAKQVSLDTLDLYSYNLQHFEVYLGDRDRAQVDVAAVTPYDINGYLSLLGQSRRFEGHPSIKPRGRLSPYTISQHYRVLKTLFNWARNMELVADSPMRKVEKPRVPDEEMPVLEDEEVVRLLEAIDMKRENGLRNVAIVALLLDTGLRRGEVIHLACHELDLERREVRVKRGKGGKNRTVPLLDAVKVLATYLKARPSLDSGGLFLTKSGEPLKGDGVQSMLRRLGEKAGVQHCNAHTFRHTFARNYLRRGGDVETLRRIMGHKSIETTRRYLNLVIDDVKQKHQQVSPAGAFSGYLKEKLKAIR